MTASQPAVEQQRIEELCAAAMRAVSGEYDLHFRARQVFRGDTRIAVNAPHLECADDESLGARRGVSDGISLKLKFSDAGVHRRLCPASPVARLVFEMLEQFRVESLVPSEFHGIRANLDQRFDAWSDGFAESGFVDTELGILMFSVALICRARIHGGAVAERYEDTLESTRAGLAPLLGPHFAGIRRHLEHQENFARHALAIARIIDDSVIAAEASAHPRKSRDDARRSVFALLIDFIDENKGGQGLADSGDSKTLADSADGYRVFSRRYDREVDAGELVRAARLDDQRRRLDEMILKQGINITRLARLFRGLLSIPVHDGVNFGEESGRIDGRRLTQLIASPAERRLFLSERHAPRSQCLFTVLVDCSGSMRKVMDQVACLVDILSRALTRAGVDNEILGFTTNAWSGGRVQRDWLRAGRPEYPGRLNETCHLAFKDADTSWRRARRSLAALLTPELFREGVDGEALEWACRRSLSHDAKRHIVLVISDGSPMDTSTALANDPYYLDNHLKQVINNFAGGVDIIGFGVGLDLSPYYNHSVAVDLEEGLNTQHFLDILEVLRGHHRR
ncbi:MAG: cobaltochelatase subunit CobT [marine bacterium B5-7]|nr:MAG: cobaltochelatase subunit CobT [marine bacterium B5-7]